MSFIGTITAIPGLVAYYPLNDTYTTQDIVGGRNATNFGGVTFGPTGATFTGSNYLQIADSDVFSAATTGELTVVCFVTVTNWAGGTGTSTEYVHWAGKGTGTASAGNQEWSFRHYRDGGTGEATTRQGWMSFYHFSPDGPSTGLGTGSRVLDPTNRPTDPMEPTTELVVGGVVYGNVASGGEIEAWRDGVKRDNDPLSGYTTNPYNGTAPVTIGRRGDNTGSLIGKVRRFAVFSRRLNQSEMQTIYAARNDIEGTVNDGAGIPTLGLHNLVERFNAGAGSWGPGTEWATNSNGTANLSVVGGRLNIVPQADATTAGLQSNASWSLMNSGVLAEMTSPVFTSGTGDCYARMYIRSAASASNTDAYIMLRNRTTDPRIYFFNRVAGADDATGAVGDSNVTLNLTTDKWVKVRADPSWLYFETSADGATWQERRKVPAPAWVSNSDIYVRFDAFRNASTTTNAVFDNINNPSGGTGVLTGDTFTAQDTAKWDFNNGAAVSNGNLVLTPNTQVNALGCGIVSKATVDLQEGPITINLTGYPTSVPSPTARFTLNLSSSYFASTLNQNRMYFSIPMVTSTPGLLEAGYTKNGVESVVSVGSPLPWMRLRKVGNDVLWETSTNGYNWLLKRSVSITSLPDIHNLYVTVGATGPGTTAGAFTVASVNTAPESPPPTVPTAPATFTATPGVEQIALSWTAPSDDGGESVASYILRGTGVPGGSLLLPPDTLAYTATGLTAGAPYTFTVAARNLIGEGPPASVTASPDYDPADLVPGPPTGVTAVAGSASARVSWTAPSVTNGTITGYRVIDQNNVIRGAVAGTVVSTTITGLSNNVTYKVRVVATNASGDSAPSVESPPFVPVASGDSESPLSTRACFGALPGATTVASLEQVVGRVLQPVVYDIAFGAALPSAEIAAIADRDRHALVRVDMSGTDSFGVANGSYDEQVARLGDAIDAVDRYVYVCPYFGVNDRVQPWSPWYSSASPGYSAAADCRTGTPSMAVAAFRQFARALRARTSRARMVWAVSVEPQPTPAGNDWLSYYPGTAADIVMLVGRNFGTGPVQGLPGQTAWATPQELFNYPVGIIGAATDSPFWLWTACHDPSVPYAPVGPGFPAGSLVPADPARSKVSWVADLFASDQWPQVQAVVWESRAGTRNWPVDSSLSSSAAFQDALGDQQGWVRTAVVHDTLGDHVRGLLSGLAKWARSGAVQAERTNLYARPDARTGVRVSVVHSTPYSQGAKTVTTVGADDMLRWNRLHGLILRQVARYGMQGWAYASGALPPSHTSLMWPGTVTGGSVVLDGSRDTAPGSTMQSEGGMKEASA